MFQFLVLFIVTAVLLAASYFFTPSPKMQNAKKAALNEFDFPTNSNARVIPEIFGRCEVHGNIIYSGGMKATAIRIKSGGDWHTTGFAYFFDMAYALCGRIDKFVSFKMNGDIVATPNLTVNGNFTARTGKSAQVQGSGNGNSTLSVYLGNQTTADTYLSDVASSPLIYNGVSYIVFKQAFIGDNTTSAPNYSAVVERTNLLSGWSSPAINTDANPAHILYYILNKLASYSEDMLDGNSFAICGETLYNEGLGMSFVMSSENEAQEWCEEILRTIDAALQVDRTTGKIKLKLIRDDYNVNSLQIADENVCSDVTFERKSWEDTFSKITIKYTDKNTFQEASITGTNDVALTNLGYEKAQTIEYMGISSAQNANLVLDRLFRKMAYPLASVKFKVSILDFPSLNIGDVLLFSNSALGVNNLVIRILSIGADREDEQVMEIEATEDIFSIGSILVSGAQPNESIPEDTSIGELIYYDVKNAYPEMTTQKAIVPLAAYPTGFVQSVEASEADGMRVEVARWLRGKVKNSYSASTSIIIDRNVGIYITPLSPGFANISASDEAWQQLRYFAYIGNEIVAYQYCSAQVDGSYYLSNIIRGIGGTPITAHAADESVWLSSESFSEIRVLPIESNTPNITFTPKNFAQWGTPKTSTGGYNFAPETPLTPQIISKKRLSPNLIEIQISPRVRQRGANYRMTERIRAGEDEGLMEGRIRVSYDNSSVTYTEFDGDRIIFQNTATTAKNYVIRCEMANFISNNITVNI